MRAGRYFKERRTRPFFITNTRVFDWGVLDAPTAPSALRSAAVATLQSGGNEEFCSALVPLQDFLTEKTDFAQTADRSWELSAEIFDQPLPAPVQPANFICVGLNYRDHAAESKMEIPKRPLLFAKSGNSTGGHNHRVMIPNGCEQMDFEAELAVVIGRRCRGIPADDAQGYVAGYTCVNDLSARDFQFADGQWYRGKSCDGFGPIGPWIVTPDEVGDPHALSIGCRLNGVPMQDSTTRNLIFGIPQLVEFISTTITLEPGDVIATGTPPGVGFARKPPVYLKAGDTVEVVIDRVGVLRNTIASGREDR